MTQLRHGADEIPHWDGTQTGGPIWMTPFETANVLGVTKRTIHRWAATDRLPQGWQAWPNVSPLRIICSDARVVTLGTQNVLESDRVNFLSQGDPAETDRDTSPKSVPITDDSSGDDRDSWDKTPGTLRHSVPSTELGTRMEGAEREVAFLRDLVETLRTESAWLQGRVEASEREKERLLELLPRSLPPARRSWWPFWRRRDGGTDAGR